MPKRKPDRELLKAIGHHLAATHRTGILAEGEIAYDGRTPPAGAKVLFQRGSEAEPAWFRCLLCQSGFNRYRADFYALRPSPWAFAQIREHFAGAHGIPELPRGWIFTQGGDRTRARCDWQPATEGNGASIHCYSCPEGSRNHYLELAPYGDARRLAEVLRWNPQLRAQLGGMSSEAQADEVELFDRGLQLAGRRKSIKRVLAEARGQKREPQLSPIMSAWRALLLAEVGAGKTASDAIAGLVRLQERDPVGFRCRIGEHLPDLESALELDPKSFAEQLVVEYGYPERTDRTVWGLWATIPAPERAVAEAAGAS